MTDYKDRDEAWLKRLKKERPDVYGDATLETDLFQLMLEKGVHANAKLRERLLNSQKKKKYDSQSKQ